MVRDKSFLDPIWKSIKRGQNKSDHVDKEGKKS